MKKEIILQALNTLKAHAISNNGEALNLNKVVKNLGVKSCWCQKAAISLGIIKSENDKDFFDTTCEFDENSATLFMSEMKRLHTESLTGVKRGTKRAKKDDTQSNAHSLISSLTEKNKAIGKEMADIIQKLKSLNDRHEELKRDYNSNKELKTLLESKFETVE